jgi:hypothetical protein
LAYQVTFQNVLTSFAKIGGGLPLRQTSTQRERVNPFFRPGQRPEGRVDRLLTYLPVLMAKLQGSAAL